MSAIEQNQAQHGAKGKLAGLFQKAATALGYSNARGLSVELAILLAICAVAAAWAVFLFGQFEFQRLCRGFDFWFDSDPARTVANITSRWVIFHERSVLHPLYSLLIAAPFGALEDALGLKTSTLTAIYVGLQSAVLAGASYVIMRGFGLLRLDALLGVLLLYSTAAFIYWIGFPEWIAFGVFSMLACVLWIVSPASWRNHATGVTQNFISGTISATTWSLGALASLISDFPKLRWKQAFEHTRDAIALMATLTVIQYLIFPTAGGFLNIWREAGYFVAPSEAEAPFFDYIIQFFGQTLAAPQVLIGAEGAPAEPPWGILLMSSQMQGVALTPLSIALFALWAALTVLGLRTAWRGAVSRSALTLVLGALLYFFLLHAVLGGEVFLFTMHFAPLMTFIAMWATRMQRKLLARGLVVALIAISFANNYPAFDQAVATHNGFDLVWLDRVGHVAPSIVAETDCN